MTTDNKTCHRIKKFCWQSNPKSPGLLFWVFYFRRTEFSTDGAVTRIEFQLSHLKDFKLKQRSASFGIQRNFKLNKDSQTEIFSLVSAVSNPKEPKTSTNFCILCAVREELTYICRVCLTKVYPLFSDREEFILCSCRQGRLSSVSGREEFIL